MADLNQTIKKKAQIAIFSGLTALVSCGEPDNVTNIYNTGNAQNATCEDIISGYLASCPGYNEEEKDALEACHEWNLPQISGFNECVYSANCDMEEVKLCYCYAVSKGC